MVSKRIPTKGGAEHDVFSRWRKLLCYTQRPGVCKFIKRQYNRRLRKVHKQEVANAVAD